VAHVTLNPADASDATGSGGRKRGQRTQAAAGAAAAPDALTISTIHAAKGLEWHSVWVSVWVCWDWWQPACARTAQAPGMRGH
jgi:hypothetical protein